MVPHCSIQSLPTMILWTQHCTLVHVYASFILECAECKSLVNHPGVAYLGNSTVTTPFGCISTLFPQNFSFGWIDPWKIQSLSKSAWKADTGGWWLTCSQIILNSSRSSSYVSPRSGLKGLPSRSQFEAKALTAKPAIWKLVSCDLFFADVSPIAVMSIFSSVQPRPGAHHSRGWNVREEEIVSTATNYQHYS